LEPFIPKLQLQVLHLRFTGSEYLRGNLRQQVLSEIGYRDLVLATDSHIHIDQQLHDLMSIESQGADSNSVSGDEYTECSDWYSSSAVEVREFADWVFGPEGIADLKILAYGDFSYQDRYSQQQVILGRSETHGSDAISSDSPNRSYRPTYGMDCEVWNDVEDGEETLRACPLDLVEYHDP
jgi:hypothetical protein